MTKRHKSMALILVCMALAGMGWAPAVRKASGQALASEIAESGPRPAPSFWFNRYATHWGMLDEAFIDYAVEVRPQVIQVGFWGPGYYSAVAYAMDKGEPALFSGIGGGQIDGEQRRRMIRRAQEAGIKVIGHFSLTMFYGDLERNQGFFKYVDEYWDEERLGPRIPGEGGAPIRVTDFLQAGPDGVRKQNWYNIEGGSEYWADPANPYYREILKRFVKAGIDDGLDGFAIVFPHLEYADSPHVINGFRDHLRRRYNVAELSDRFGIDDLDNHAFETVTGWYEPEEAGELKLEMLTYVQQVLWEVKQEVFMDYGRSLKPDLLVGQWNHIYRSSMSGPGQLAGVFAQLNADEQSTLPAEQWSANENWVWYSIGNWRMYWDPSKDEFSQFSLVYRYLHEAGGGLPQAVKTDDNRNVAMYMAEGIAHAGFAYARGPNYRNAETVATVRKYFDFMRDHEAIYREVESHAPVALVFPRMQVHHGDTSALPAFKTLGERLLRAHVLFDVVVDEQLDDRRRQDYDVVLEPGGEELTPGADAALDQAMNWSIGELPPDVIATAWHQHNHKRLMLHLVNHTYHLPPETLGRAADFEHPDRFAVDLPIPAGVKITAVTLHQPGAESRPLDFDQINARLRFDMGPMGTYAVAQVEYE